MKRLIVVFSWLVAWNVQGQSDFDQLDRAIQQVIEDSLCPGLALTVFTPDTILYEAYAGVEDWETYRPVGPHSIFEAASLSKPMFAYLFLEYRQLAGLTLTTPVEKILPLADLKGNPRRKRITPDLLLSHQSGLPNWRGTLQVDATTYDQQFPPNNKLKLVAKPGKTFSYSGEGFLYLQRVLEKQMGKSLEELAREALFIPLGMPHSTYSEGHRFHSGLTRGINSQKESRPMMTTRLPVAAASLLTTAPDYTAFLQKLMENDQIRTEMCEPLVHVDEIGQTAIAWGRGVGITETPHDTYLFHWGDNGSYKAYFFLSLSEKKGLVWFANSDQGLSFRDALVKCVFGRNIPMWPSGYDQNLE